MNVAFSMVMLSVDVPLSIDAFERDFAERWSGDPSPTGLSEGENTMSCQIGDGIVTIGAMPVPIPWSDLEGPCATSLFWKNATEEVKVHKIHAIVTVMADLNSIQMATLLTKVTTSVMESTSAAIGVYWGSATLVIPKEIFTEFATEILPLGPPLHIWVNFRVGPDEDGETSSGFTQGMKALGLMELEAEQSPEAPAELRDRLYGLAEYLVENGPIVNDGDTIGEDAHEKIRIAYSKSAFGHEDKVMRLEYETASYKKPWWKPW